MDCKEGRVEISKPEAERSSCVAENTGTAETELDMELEGQDKASRLHSRNQGRGQYHL